MGQCSLNSPSNACRDAAGGGRGVGEVGGGGVRGEVRGRRECGLEKERTRTSLSVKKIKK